jgi:hypothetical protein
MCVGGVIEQPKYVNAVLSKEEHIEDQKHAKRHRKKMEETNATQGVLGVTLEPRKDPSLVNVIFVLKGSVQLMQRRTGAC